MHLIRSLGLTVRVLLLQYVVERHGKTLLPQYIGMYRLTVEGQETYLVVTRNIFSSYLPVHVKYDLKVSGLTR